jgi:hypothetical protein
MPKSAERTPALRTERQSVEARPTREEIELRAYQIYLERGGAQGQDLEDWLRAERELLASYRKTGRMATLSAN